MGSALPLARVAAILGVHSRRCSEALAELAATTGQYGSIAGVGLFRFETAEEKRLAIRPEANRLKAISVKLRGMGWRRHADVLDAMTLELFSEGRP